jgi:hypothetical protein
MAKPEWYSGSDRSGRVASTIEDVIAHMDAQEMDHEDLENLELSLTLEKDLNWRSFIHGLMGLILYELDDRPAARRTLELSISGARAHLASFDGVLSVYCQVCYTLGTILFESSEWAEASSCFLRCLPYVHEVYEDVYRGNVYAYLQECFNRINRPVEAVVFGEAAVLLRGNDPETLERLLVSYVGTGQLNLASEIYTLIMSSSDDEELLRRVTDIADEHLSGTGIVN